MNREHFRRRRIVRLAAPKNSCKNLFAVIGFFENFLDFRN